jgi:hypothetical protein
MEVAFVIHEVVAIATKGFSVAIGAMIPIVAAMTVCLTELESARPLRGPQDLQQPGASRTWRTSTSRNHLHRACLERR